MLTLLQAATFYFTLVFHPQPTVTVTLRSITYTSFEECNFSREQVLKELAVHYQGSYDLVACR